MSKIFSFFNDLKKNLETIDIITNSVKFSLGPCAKNILSSNERKELTFLENGLSILQSLKFNTKDANTILQLLEQAAAKTYQTSGDGSTTTILITGQLLKHSLKFVSYGCNPIQINNGLKKNLFFLINKVSQLSSPILNKSELLGVIKTAIGKKFDGNLSLLFSQALLSLKRDNLILVEENILEQNEIEVVNGIELEQGYASSYFINDYKSFEVSYTNPYVLIINNSLESISQIRDILEYIKTNKHSLIIVTNQIASDVLSTLVLNNIQKKLKIAVIKFSSIKFVKSGILEDLALLAHANLPSTGVNLSTLNLENFRIDDLGQVEKVIIKKNTSTFIFSKFTEILKKRRINELNRELLLCEANFEKSIFKTRIARLSSNIIKIKFGLINQYQKEEKRKKIESGFQTLRSALEEGIFPGGGFGYIYLREELKNWGNLNLVGDEAYSIQILLDTLMQPTIELLSDIKKPVLLQEVLDKNFPYTYNIENNKIEHSFNMGLVDSSKSVRSCLWNSITLTNAILISL